MVDEAKQRREEKRRQGIYKKNISFNNLFLIKCPDPHREQQRQVSKVLLDGLYDSDSPLSNLLGVRTEVVGEIIWQNMLVWNWQMFPSQ